MIMLLSGSAAKISKFIDVGNIGQLITPQAPYKVFDEVLYAVDNAAYSNWDEVKFLRLLETLQDKTPLFVAAPDVVGDAKQTHKNFRKWEPVIRNFKHPVALVLQDGQESIGVDWKSCDAIFIGGSTEFKLGEWVKYAVKTAKSKGKWVHMGRVNSLNRIKYAYDIGCDSFDGSGYSRFTCHVPKALEYINTLKEQPCLL